MKVFLITTLFFLGSSQASAENLNNQLIGGQCNCFDGAVFLHRGACGDPNKGGAVPSGCPDITATKTNPIPVLPQPTTSPTSKPAPITK